MYEECLICKAPLEYLDADEDMECAICHKQERSKTRCVEGHYVCSECHTQEMYSRGKAVPSGKSDDAFMETIRLIEEKVLDLRKRLA